MTDFPDSIRFFLRQDWFVFPVICICISAIVYFQFDRAFAFLKLKSLNTKDEVLRLLDLMFVETEPKKVTYLMLMLSFGLGFLVFFLLLPNVAPAFVAMIAVTIAGWSLPLKVVQSLHAKRCDRLVEQMVDGLTIMANGVKSGLSVTQSMERVVENMGNPVSQEFNLVLSQIRLGRSVEEALIEFGDRIKRPDIDMFVIAINILKETGGNLAETFQTIVLTIRERQKIQKKIEAMTAQAKTQGAIISCVPFGLFFMFKAMDPTFVEPMTTTALGWAMLGVMVILVVIGSLTMRKIATIDV